MEIVVQGTGKKEVFPDLIKIKVEFNFLEKTYDKSLETGTKIVNEFVGKVLPKLKLNKEDMKTKKFSIKHITENDYKSGKEKEIGYEFNQVANIEFDYDKKKINTFMSEILKLEKVPEYNIEFDIKDKETIYEEALKLAYNECEKKARLIATASNLKLKVCQKINFEPIDNIRFLSTSSSEIIGNSDLDIPQFLRKSNSKDKAFTGFTDSFTPEKINIEQSIFSQWIAE